MIGGPRQGFPGSMNAVSIWAVWAQRKIAVAMSLGSVVGPKVLWGPVEAYEVGEHLDHAALIRHRGLADPH
jgi:hypothetical protein